MYLEQKPRNQLLTSVVDAIWTSTNSFGQQTIFPDGSADLIIRKNNLGTQVLFCGVMNRPKFITTDVNDIYWGIRFKPGFASLYFNSPMNESLNDSFEIDVNAKFLRKSEYYLQQNNLSFESIEKIALHSLTSKFCSCSSFQKKINFLKAIGSIKFETVEDASKDLNLSRRHFQRTFKAMFGLSPREYLSIKRFHHLTKVIEEMPLKSLNEYAQECGYYDQSDMNRQVKKFSNLTPLALMSQIYNTV